MATGTPANTPFLAVESPQVREHSPNWLIREAASTGRARSSRGFAWWTRGDYGPKRRIGRAIRRTRQRYASSQLDDSMEIKHIKPTALWAALIVALSVLAATIVVPSIAYLFFAPLKAAALVGAFVVALPMSSWSVRAMRRFCGRLIPLSSGGRRMLAPALACFAGCVFAAVAVVDLVERLLILRNVAGWLETGGALLITATTCCIALALQARQYFRPPAIQAPYILYLRTFLGFSDHAVTAALFTIVGGRNPIVVLTAPHSDAASWDPVLIAFRGNPVVRLSAKSPIFMHSKDREWEHAVRNLVDGASRVVVDISDMSAGIRAELEMVGRVGISTKVIWLTDAEKSDRVEQIRALVGSAHMPPERVIAYRRSWFAALPNLLIGICLSELFMFVSLLLANDSLRSVATPRELGYVVGTLTARSLPGLLLFTAIFARPAIDGRTQKALRSLLVSP